MLNPLSHLGRLARGALAGIGGTVAMSVPMLAARRIGVTPMLPPEVMVAKTTPLEKGAGRNAVVTVSHLGYGAVCGALVSLLPATRKSMARSMATGAAAGLSIWAGSYAGWIPAFGLLPDPEGDHPGRRRTMIASHAVFGVATALGIRWLEQRSRAETSAPAAVDAVGNNRPGAPSDPLPTPDPVDPDPVDPDPVDPDPVDEAIDESFPASDPPSWTGGR